MLNIFVFNRFISHMKKHVKILVILILLSSFIAIILFRTNILDKETKKIGITQIATHPSLDAVREGIIAGLSERGYIEGKNLEVIFRNANGDQSVLLPITQGLIKSKIDVLIPITTPCALAAAKSTQTIPIVMAGITDPVGVGLVKSLNGPNGNITGTSDQWPFEKQIQTFKQLIPTIKSIGYLYRPGDDVSKVAIDSFENLCPKYDIEFVKMPVSSSSNVYISAVTILKRVDAIYCGLDELIVENLESLIKAGNEANKPVLAGDEGSVKRGALITYSISMRSLGVITGHLVAEILNGKDVSMIPIYVVSEGECIINMSALNRLGIDINKSQLKEYKSIQ